MIFIFNFNFFLLLLLRWRTKQNLDYSFLMMYAVSKGVYYVQVRLRGGKRKHLSRTELPPPPSQPCWGHFHSQPDPSWPRASLISLLGNGRSPIWLRFYMKVVHMQMRAFDSPAPRTRRKLSLFSQSRLVLPSPVLPGRGVAQPSRTIFSLS